MGCGFVSYQYHASAQMAIDTLNGTVLNGWTIRLSWGNAPVIPYQPQMYYDPYYYYYPPMPAAYFPVSYSTDSSLTTEQSTSSTQQDPHQDEDLKLEDSIEKLKIGDEKVDSGEEDVKTL